MAFITKSRRASTPRLRYPQNSFSRRMGGASRYPLSVRFFRQNNPLGRKRRTVISSGAIGVFAIAPRKTKVELRFTYSGSLVFSDLSLTVGGT